MAKHHFSAHVKWTGNTGAGTSSYTGYGRDYEISADGKPAIPGSAAAAFRGDAARYNPEDLLVASLSACHMLWVLHLCSEAKILVEAYEDEPVGELAATGAEGQFASVTLRPRVTVRGEADEAALAAIHEKAHKLCFIARSVNFPVVCEPRLEVVS